MSPRVHTDADGRAAPRRALAAGSGFVPRVLPLTEAGAVSEHAVVVDPGPGGWPPVSHETHGGSGYFVARGHHVALDISLDRDTEAECAQRVGVLTAIYLHRAASGEAAGGSGGWAGGRR